jgi:hypothetical protein
MDQIINLVKDKAGISAEQSKQAVDIVVGFLKDKLSAPIAGQIDGVLSGEGVAGSVAGGVGDLATGATDLLGGK